MVNISEYIEHTLLKPDATEAEVTKLVQEAIVNKFLGVCINPCYIEHARTLIDKNKSPVKVVTVVGFPLGAMNTVAKVIETKLAIEDGADEIDMVINVGAMKNQNYEYAGCEIKLVKEACGDKPLKVIIETDLLTKEEKIKACELCVEMKADFVKTSTGFVKNGIGATVEDVKLMYETVSPYGLKVKASAGIRDKQKALDLIAAGASRLGTSSGVNIILDETPAKTTTTFGNMGLIK